MVIKWCMFHDRVYPPYERSSAVRRGAGILRPENRPVNFCSIQRSARGIMAATCACRSATATHDPKTSGTAHKGVTGNERPTNGQRLRRRS